MRIGHLAVVAGAVLVVALAVFLSLHGGRMPQVFLPDEAPVAASSPSDAVPGPTPPAVMVSAPHEPPSPVATASPDPSDGDDEVQGRVLSSEGLSVCGVHVRALARRVFQTPAGALSEDREEREALTDSGGCFRIERLRRDLPHTLVVEGEARGRLFVDFDPRPGSAGIVDLGDLVLPAVRALSGTAFDRPGEPLGGATVRIRGGDGGRDRFRPGKPPAVGTASLLRRETTTDDRGRFRFEGLTPGDYEMTLVVPGGVDTESVATVPAVRDLSGLELVASPGATLAIRLMDEAGKAVPGIIVNPRGPGAPYGVGGLTDAEGRIVVRSLPSLPLSFAICEQAELGKDPLYGKEEIGPFVPAGQEVAVVLRVTAPLQGVVVDAEGEPLDGMYVDVLEEGRRLQSLTAVCDGKGRFRVDLAQGRTVGLRVAGTQGEFIERAYPAGKLREWKGNHETLYRGSLGPVTAPAEGLVLRCREIAQDRSLSVRVVDPEGHPMAGVVVSWYGPSGWSNAGTDAAGIARCERMLADTTRVHVTKHPPEAAAKDLVPPALLEVVPEGQTVDLAYRRGLVVRGSVKDAGGHPAAGAKVSISMTSATDLHPYEVVADAEGCYRFACMPELRLGEVHAFWTSPEGIFQSVQRRDVLAGPGPLDLVVRPPR